MQIDYYTKSVYGLDKHYILDPKLAELCHAAFGTITLLPAQMELLVGVGCTLNRVHKPE